MAYTNAVYYLDYENGSDTARSGFAGVASNPSGDTTLITAAGHGLVDGAVVVLSAFTAWLNGSWKITVVDPDTFTLDDAVWQATADPNGTVTPNGGMNWTDAWKTITAGATAARIAPGDTIRIAKSPAPTSIGNATWTDLSKTVTLASAQTATIDNCETAWTANGAGDATVTRDAVATDAKEGSYCMRIAMDASPQVNTMQAYYDIGTLDLSAYQKITFWLKNEAAIADADTWKICLCSDNAGATPVDTFYVPAIPSTGQWVPLTLTKDGGGNLGNAIESIAIYTGGTAPTASKYIRVDNFSACTTSGLNLQSLISKNSAEQGGVEGWWPIQSIVGNTILLDNYVNNKANDGRGYSGDTETVPTYCRETIKTAMVAGSTDPVQVLNDSGGATSLIQYEGGYNTSTNEQTGETFFDGRNGRGFAIYAFSKAWNKINRLSFCRYNYAINAAFTSLVIGEIQTICACSAAIRNTPSIFGGKILNSISNYGGIDLGTNSIFQEIGNVCSHMESGVQISSGGHVFVQKLGNVKNNAARGIYLVNCPGAVFRTKGGNFANNVTASVAVSSIKAFFYGTDINSSDSVKAVIAGGGGSEAHGVAFTNLNATGYDYKKVFGTDVYSLATDRVGGTGKMWKLSPDNTTDATYQPGKIIVARIAVNANKNLDISAYVKKDHATNVGAKLVVRAGQIAGIDSDVTATASTADTDWHELALATMLPTESGVIEVEFWAYYLAGTSSAYIEDISITQAA